MMTEEEIRDRLANLDKLWENNIKERVNKNLGAPWPADFYWYVNTRRAYCEVLNINMDEASFKSIDDEKEIKS